MSSNTTNTDDDWSLYPYDPVKPLPIFFAILLALVGIYQFYQCFFIFKWKKFGTTMTWATSVWVAGFICRAISVYQTQNINIFIAQFVLVLAGPPLYAAAEYFILGRLLAYFPYFTPIHPGRVFTTFAILSVVVESLTATGAANSAGSDRSEASRQVGLSLLKAALILQCFVEAAFFSLVATLQYRCQRANLFPKRTRPVFYILYVTSGMILVRCIVRTIEGFDHARCPADQSAGCGYIGTHEWVLYVFEVANIVLFVILLAIFHPGRYLPRSSRIFLDPVDGKTEKLGPGFSKADKRPLLLTILDPFNLAMILTGRGTRMDKFWEEDQPVYDGGEVKSLKDQKGSASDSAARSV